jgi:small GTP-binding protein
MTQVSGYKPPSFKIVFVGDQAVGKTSIIKAYTHEMFIEERPPTIGSAFVDQPIDTPYGAATLQLWDTAGQERYRSLVPMYARGASIAIVVFDVTVSESFDNISDWIAQVRTNVTPDCGIIVAGNKSDLDPEVTLEAMDRWASENSIDTVSVSAKTGANISLLFDLVIQKLPEARFTLAKPEDAVVLETAKEKKQNCC